MAQIADRKTPVGSHARLRELGIYRLPDGREFVVSTLYSDGCSLYSPQAWDFYRNAEFWVDEYGRLFRWGEPIWWRVEDLEDTGKTTTYPKPLLH
jgi:hypothetical protein